MCMILSVGLHIQQRVFRFLSIETFHFNRRYTTVRQTATPMALRVSSVVLGPYNWTRDLIYSIYSGTEKVNMVEQVEELKTQLQRATEHSISQEQKVSELSTSLDSEVKENKTLWDQVEYLTNELHRERGWRQQQTKLYKAEVAKCNQEFTQKIQLAKQLEETEKQLAHQKSQEEWLVCKEMEVGVEFEALTASYNELCQEYSNVYQAWSDIQQMYDTDLTAQKEKNDTLQQQLEVQTMHSSNRTVSGHKKLIRMMKIEQKALYQKMEHETKVAAKTEKTIRMELEDLKIKLHQETSTNLELVAKIKASQALHKEDIVQIMEELKDKGSEQREKSPAVSQDPELVGEESIAVLQDSELQEKADVSEEKAAEKNKRPSFWKRTCHVLGLRKKKKRREKESTSICDGRSVFPLRAAVTGQ